MQKLNKRPIALIILDGFGIEGKNPKADAIKKAKTPFLDEIFTKYPHTKLKCSGDEVGLPLGQMGNSEVGHMHIGAGRKIYQDLTRINNAILEKSFFQNEALLSAIKHAKKRQSTLHIMGLCSTGGVHSHLEHLIAILKLAKKEGLKKVYIHAFTDGRDVAPKSSLKDIGKLEEEMQTLHLGKIATITGRYYAMDRDKRWDRIAKAYEAITHGVGVRAEKAEDAILCSYQANVTDEFILPVVLDSYQGMKKNDSVIFFNFRPDRARELSHAFTDDEFTFFVRDEDMRPFFVTMTEYEQGLNAKIAFPKEKFLNTLGETIAKANFKQLRIAETEKYAHVTFFFNGGREKPYKGEDRILVPSPKVSTYDLKPEMSAIEITEQTITSIQQEKYDFIILNYANCDMVGHTGNIEATIKAVETIDHCLNLLVTEILKHNGIILITADHGNAEEMLDEKGEMLTSHTTNPVPFIIIQQGAKITLNEGTLSDIAPTILKLAKIKIPDEMTGKPLF